MRLKLKTKILLAAVPAAIITGTVTIVALRIQKRRLRKREASSFLSEDVRTALQELCNLKGEDFVPDGVGTSLYQRRLESLSDRQLIGIYLLIKVAEVLHARGATVHSLSKAELVSELSVIRERTPRQNRHELLKFLGSFGIDTVRSVLSDALMLAGSAA